MSSIVILGDRIMRWKLWPVLLGGFTGLAIGGVFIATSHLADKQYAEDYEQEIPGLTIEQRPNNSQPKVEKLIVTSVASMGPAHDAGIAAGDVIDSIDGRPVASMRELHETVDTLAGPVVHLDLHRGRAAVSLDLPEAPQPDK